MTTNADNGGQTAAEPTPAPEQETGRAQGHTPDPDHSDKLAQPQEPPAEPQPEQAPVEEDVDALTLAELKKAVEAEDKPAQAEPTPAAQPPTVPQAPAPAAQPRPVMVPKARLDEVLSKSDENARAAAYWQGVAEARAAGQPAPGQTAQQQPPAPTPEQQIAAIREKQADLASKFDKGEIGMSEWIKQNGDLDDQIQGARLLQLQPKAAPKQQQEPQAPREPTLYIQRETAKLEEQHPFSLLITEDEDWNLIETKARKQLATDPEYSQTPAGEYKDFLLRQRMAELTDVYGPAITGKTKEQIAPKAPNGQQPPSPQQQPGLTPQAQQRLAKLNQAATAPPNINQLGTVTAGTGIPTEDEIAQLSEEQYEALPAATRTAIRQRMNDSFG